MTLSTFFMILAIILFIEGIIGIYFSDRMDNQSTFLFALIFLIMSIILFISCYGLSNNNYIIPKFYWLVFIVPITYAIILLWLFFTKDYIFPWDRNYYKEYKNLRKEFDTLQNNYNKLNKDYYKLEEIHQQEINNILNKTLLQINSNNPKLYL